MKILFVLSHVGFFRHFEQTIDILRQHGHDVQIAITKSHKSISNTELGPDYDRLIQLELRTTDNYRSYKRVERQRVARDILFYADNRFRDAKHLLSRFVTQQKKGTVSEDVFRRRLSLFRRLPAVIRALLDKYHQRVEDRTPAHPNAVAVLQQLKPDLVVTSPLVQFGSREIEVVKAARTLGIRTFFPVASWDNLTNKGRLKVMPDMVAVWNDAMAQESALHGVPSHKVRVTGAPVFDWWFNFDQVWTREYFLEKAGHSASKNAIIVYVCSSDSIGGGSEKAVLTEWVRAVRGSDNPAIAAAHIVVRPHPMSSWSVEVSDEYSVFPLASKHPSSAAAKEVYYNTLYHADAIVGLNTSAMIEAAILGKPVLSFRGHDSDVSQSANLHFQHLAGFTEISRDLKAHIADLGATMQNPAKKKDDAEAFVRRFIRPGGPGKDASLILAELLMEQLPTAKGAQGA